MVVSLGSLNKHLNVRISCVMRQGGDDNQGGAEEVGGKCNEIHEEGPHSKHVTWSAGPGPLVIPSSDLHAGLKISD